MVKFLHLHQTLGSQSFLSNISHSMASPSSLLSWKNTLWLDILLSGLHWKPITLFSKSIFTLIKKNVRDLVVRNNEYTRDEGFLKGLWRNFVSTRLISCVIILASLVCFPCFNSVSYDFHCFQYSQGKTMFYSAQCKNGWLAASDLFDMFIQWIKFYYTFYYYV